MIEETTFESIEEFKKELEEHLIYYNEFRLHQALKHKTPSQMNEDCERA
ncbi:MAG: integrase core domain-containing protein [Oligoflexia bacterium]|nr:integrase core domain-containing protein [Oligoflexia bacterium]